MIHFFCAEQNDILIRPLHRYDIEYLREWRNNAELSRFLRSVDTVTAEAQIEWYKKYLEDNDTYFFAIDYKRKRTVGALALYNIKGNSCDIGKFVIGDQSAKGHRIAENAFLMAMGIAKVFLNKSCFRLSVHEDNVPARHVYEGLGFYKIGEHPFAGGGIEYEMEADFDSVEKLKPAAQINYFRENDTEIICGNKRSC